MDLLYSSVPLPLSVPNLIYKFETTITTAKKYFCLKTIYGRCPSTLSVVSQDLYRTRKCYAVSASVANFKLKWVRFVVRTGDLRNCLCGDPLCHPKVLAEL